MAASDDSDVIAVIAVDFGTTFCGYAFSLVGKESELFLASDWGEHVGIPHSFKTPTCLLTSERNDFIALGYEAMKEWQEIVMDRKDTHVRFYEKFKLVLHTAQHLGPHTLVADHKGAPAKALDIFALVLKELADTAVKKLTSMVGKEFLKERLRWVVTVPAIWSDSAKYFMKMAALQAGLINDINTSALSLVLEPEAASICCQQVPSNSLSVGDSYIVIDAGGGTIDIAFHEVIDGNRLREICTATGCAIGASQIEDRFSDLLDKITGRPFVKQFKKTAGYTYFMNRFEIKKRVYTGKKRMAVELCGDIKNFYFDLHEKSFTESIEMQYREKGVTIRSGFLILPTDIATDLFLPIIERVVRHIKYVLSHHESCNVNKIVMVGGFSDCIMLQEAITREFSEKTIIRPTNAWSAILTGAVLLGHNQRHIRSRVLRKTYGIQVLEDFDEVKHDMRSKVVSEGKVYARVFCKFATRGEQIGEDSVKTHTLFASKSDQTEIVQEWFSTYLEHPKYVDERGVEKIGQLRIPFPGRGLERKVIIIMKFGGTEIVIETRLEITKKHTLDLFTY